MSAASYATAQLLRVLPRARIGRAVGRLAEHRWPPAAGRTIVGLYARAYGVALDECSRHDWASFDAFFTRALRDGTRPIDPSPLTIVSPADGEVQAVAAIDGAGTLTVKGRPYTVAELVGSEAEAARFRGGLGIVVYLSPRDYHRVHAPVGGVLRAIRSLPGDYFPVNAVGTRHVPGLLARNRRVAFAIDSEVAFGRVTVVMVVAMIVGRITTPFVSGRDVPIGEHRFEPPLPMHRGAEIGTFHLGSTAVVLVENASTAIFGDAVGPVQVGRPLLRTTARAATSSGGAT